MNEKKSQLYEVAPLKLVQEIGNSIPEIWENLDMIHDMRGVNGIADWPDEYYMCSMTFADNHLLCNQFNLNMFQIMHFGMALPALAEWRKNKIVYVFDRTMETELTETKDVEISRDMMLRLPYRCFFIKTTTLKVRESTLDGFIVNFSWDTRRQQEVVGLTPCFGDVALETEYLLAENGIIKMTGIEDIDPIPEKENLKDQFLPSIYQHAVNRRKVLQLILYIISENSDVIPENEKTRSYIYQKKETAFAVKDRHREIKRWDVGTRKGPALKKAIEAYKYKSDKSTAGSHSGKRPHMRRAHWHRYWTGSASSGDRKVIIKWLHPMMIGKLNADEDPAVLCQVG